MSVRFCAQCGTKALAAAKFCTECGAALPGGGAASAARRWQVTAAGSAVLTGFLAAGLAIWTLILSPGGPGAGPVRPGAAPPSASSVGGGTKARMPLPAEVVSFITDLAAKAKAKPDDIKRNPSFLQAHYNLAVTYHGQGDDRAALGELEIARGLASEDGVRKQIDDMIAALRGEGPAPEDTRAAPPTGAGGPRTPFQGAVEQAFRTHPIMGPRIVRFEWTAPAAGRVLVQNFPMEGMPAAVREKFTGHLGDELRNAAAAHPVGGPVRVEIADVATGTVMATITP